ncbi:MAG: DUF2007 domain-containing protein [Terracidiphilus sp.]|jgi:hypothetical protein
MQVNPIEEWQRLTEQYREMSDDELRDLSADFVVLTETAQQVLRNEMKKRGLDEPRDAVIAPKSSDRPAAPQWDPAVNSSNATDENEETDLPHEYTWKTVLCECDDRDQAWQVSEALKQAGIESWIEQPGSRYSFGISNPRILVAADQLDQARRIAAQPIPQEIIDLSKMAPPEFEAPACPQCGAKDPVLEGVDPFNSWRCEACGKLWTESAGDLNQTPEMAGY